MKKFIILLLAVLTLSFNADAEESKSESRITLAVDTHPYNNDYSGQRHRSAMRILIEAWYIAESNTIEISYDGEDDGEVFLFLDDAIIGYETNINTTIQLPLATGQYQIVIVGENWEATGYIQL